MGEVVSGWGVSAVEGGEREVYGHKSDLKWRGPPFWWWSPPI